MIMGKHRSFIIFIVTVLSMGSFSSAAWISQEAEEPQLSEEERKEALERLNQQIQEAQPFIRKTPEDEEEAPQPAPITPAKKQSVPPVSKIVQRDSGMVQLQYENADLYDFINQISSTLGLTPIVIDEGVKGSVTIQSSAPMPKSDVLPLFNLILKNNNAALIKQDDIYMIVPISSALKKGVEVFEHLPPSPAESESEQAPEGKTNEAAPKPATSSAGAQNQAGLMQSRTSQAPAGPQSQIPESGFPEIPELSTHVIRVEFMPVKDLIEPIKLFMTEGGVIMPYERLNMLILTDYSDSVERILEIIHLLDKSYLDPDLVELVQIHNNASADVVEDLKKIFGSGAQDSATGISFVSLDRLNAIFVMASSKRGLGEIKRWIDTLDATSGRNIQTFVYVVQNSTASNIAMMLAALYGGEGSPQPGSQGTGGTGGAYSGGTQGGAFGTGTNQSSLSGSQFGRTSAFQSGGYQGGYSGGYQGGYGGGYGGGGVFGTGQQLGPRLERSRTITSQILTGGAFSGLQDTVRLVVDDVNNSLIIQSTAADFAYLSETIKKMDVLPRQAIIDARIFEIDLTNALRFGVNAVLQGRTGDQRLTTGAISAEDGALSASTFAFVGNSREILMNLEALRTKTNVRILEAPSVLALDGTQAQIIVGAEIPYPGTSFTPSVGGTTTSVQYRNTGISLIVVPYISASGSVTLDIVQEISSPGAETPTGPTFSKASVQTTLSVKDGETAAIAGLIREADKWSRSGVPFFSEIPVLGSLFGKTTKDSNRTELIILITPHVIRTPEALDSMTQDLKDSLRHTRKFVDKIEQDHRKDMEEARQEREAQMQNSAKETQPAEKKD